MKKLLIVLASIVIIVIAAAALVPVLFEDKIKVEIDKALAKSVNAEIVWDTEDFSLSLFTNFPNATATLKNFGVINRAPFDGQILFAVRKFEVEVDIFSLFGDQIQISGIELDQPEIFIKVLEDGTANYDIAIADESADATSETDTATTKFNIGIDHWSINNGHFVYDDATIPYFMELKNIQHSGSGDFTQDIFDLTTYTKADSVVVRFDGTEYVTNKSLLADAVISISEDYSKYTFKENQVKVNEFAMGFDGFLALKEDGSYEMDISYDTQENSFKSLLSLVPGIYNESFNGIETSGSLEFGGVVKGIYDSLNMPAFSLTMKVDDAMFKYPDLPTAVNNIRIDLLVDNQDGIIDNTIVNLKEFHMELGQNPIDASVLIKNLVNYDMDANVDAKLNLADLSSMFPMEGTTLKGVYSANIKASGYYDSIKNQFPKINATMSLKDGYVKSSEFPYAMEDLHFDANISDESGNLKDFKAVIKDFTMVMDGEPFKANLTFSNLDNYTWDLTAKGGVNLEKVTKIFPLDGMQLFGGIKADINTRGNMADLEAERYQQLPTSGTVTVANFRYVDKELPYEVSISNAQTSFDPQKVTINNYNGKIGKSDISIDGSVSNYMAYLFSENEKLTGTMNFRSDMLDLNEFMTDSEEESATTETGEESMGVIQVPENIDFVLKSSIKTAKINDLTLNNIDGDIIVKDGIVNLKDLNFRLLEGQFAVNGAYNAKDIDKPKYNFNLDIDNLSIQEAAKNFEIVKQYVPVADAITGKFSTDFALSGLLDQSMMPKLETISGSGLVKIANAVMNGSQSKIVSGISSLTSLNDTKEVLIRDVNMKASIEDGRLKVEPFDVSFGGYTTTISGATALDGSIDYALKMDVPAGKLGTKFNSLVSSYSEGSEGGSSTIPLKIGLGGTVNDPSPKLLMGDQKEQVKTAVKEKVKEEGKEAVKDAAKDLLDKDAKDAIGGILGGKSKNDTAKTDSTKTDLKEKIEEDAKKKIKNLFKKKGDGK